MKTIGKISWKKYACKKCGFEKQIETNHFGECYSWSDYNICPKCPPYRRPTTWVCLEKLPKGWKRPANWETVKLGEFIKLYQSYLRSIY